MIDKPKPCRHGAGGAGPRSGGRRVCGKPSVGRVQETYVVDDLPPVSMWWHYCAEHLDGELAEVSS